MIEPFIDSRGVILRRDLIAAGLDDKPLIRARKEGELVRLRAGAGCLASVWAQADRAERHRILSHAVKRQYGDDVARSHVSALLEIGGPDWGIDLRAVHLTSLFGSGERTQAGVVHHRGWIGVNDVRRHDGAWVTADARTALDTAAAAGRDPAVCVLDWVQQTRRATREELELGIARMKDWPGTVGLGYKLRLSNGASESVLECRTHLFCRDRGLPMPVPQYEIHHPSGLLAGRVDFAWPEHKTMAECDGLVKYLRLRRPGETIVQCVLREKKREDLLRRLTGWQMIRIVWADLERPAVLEADLRQRLFTTAA